MAKLTKAQMQALVARLTLECAGGDAWPDDHDERLTGDIRLAATLLTSQEAEIERLTRLLTETVAAWEALPGDRNYSVRVIEAWLINTMSPAIDELRALLRPAETGDGQP